jgi:hypothetical protein
MCATKCLEMYYKEFKAIFADFHVRLTNIEDDIRVALSTVRPRDENIAEPIRYKYRINFYPVLSCFRDVILILKLNIYSKKIMFSVVRK